MFLILFWPQYDLHPYRAKVMANSQRDRPMGNNHVTSPPAEYHWSPQTTRG